jgi:hypothetical protein
VQPTSRNQRPFSALSIGHEQIRALYLPDGLCRKSTIMGGEPSPAAASARVGLGVGGG